MADFIDSEDAVAELIDGIATVYFATPEFAAEGPEELENEYLASVPFLVVSKVDGAGNAWEQTERVQIEAYHTTRPESKALNKAVRAVLAGKEGVSGAFGYIDAIREVSSPNQIPDEQEDVRRVASTWAITSRIQ